MTVAPVAYHRSCPNCGAPVAPVVLDAEIAPWVCAVCRHGWWVAELRSAGWDHRTLCFAHREAGALRAEVDAERADARTRGMSVRPDQLALLDDAVLDGLAARGRVAEIAAERKIIEAAAAAPMAALDLAEREAADKARAAIAALVRQSGVSLAMADAIAAALAARTRGVA